jgi:hypothetical protein
MVFGVLDRSIEAKDFLDILLDYRSDGGETFTKKGIIPFLFVTLLLLFVTLLLDHY